jgi:hypothetical protein
MVFIEINYLMIYNSIMLLRIPSSIVTMGHTLQCFPSNPREARKIYAYDVAADRHSLSKDPQLRYDLILWQQQTIGTRP